MLPLVGQDGHMVPLSDILEATHRLIRTVDHMTDEEYTAPSLLPTWTRAHVIAHLTLNAEGLAGALAGVMRGRSVPMYASPEDRDGDIAELAVATPTIIRNRLLGATSEFAAAVGAMPPDGWDTFIERTPGGTRIATDTLPDKREREVQIHHADLGLAFTRSDWPDDFASRLLDQFSTVPRLTPFGLLATDLDRTWQCGEGAGEVTVSGTASDLGWWLSGRGHGDGLACTDAQGAETLLPRIEDQ